MHSLRKMKTIHKFSNLKEGVAKAIFALAACFAVLSVAAIIGYLLYAGIPAFRETGVGNFLFGTTWAPSYDGPASEKFGILPMIVGSTVATGGALLIGGTLGVAVAVFIVYFCPKKLKMPLVQLVSVLAGIPSVIYGYFGLKQIVPALAAISPSGNGTGILAVSLVLGVMILPTVASLAKDALSAVPSAYFEGALALGLTKEQGVFKIMMPSAKQGIMTALGLGIGRAVGETMAVIMVAGNTVQFPKGLFDGFMTLTGNIVMDMSYASGVHRSALVATGFVLLIFILILNAVLYGMKSKKNRKEKGFRFALPDIETVKENKNAFARFGLRCRCGFATAYNACADGAIKIRKAVGKPFCTAFSAARHAIGKIKTTLSGSNGGRKISAEDAVFKSKTSLYTALKWLCAAGAAVMVASVAYIIGFIAVKGVIAFTEIGFVEFLFGKSGAGKNSLAPAFVSTGALIGIALVIALPIGIAAAIYLVEYAKSGNRIVRVIRLFTDTLSGIPSIVFGLFGVIVFNDAFGLGYSLLSGGLTLSVMILPTVVRAVEESLINVPLSYREASYALGAGKIHTIGRVVLPCAMKGILTATVLSIGRIVSESAALLLTAGSVKNMPKSIMSPGSSFAVMMYMFASEGLYMNEAYATALVLIVVVVAINALIFAIDPKKEKKSENKKRNAKV